MGERVGQGADGIGTEAVREAVLSDARDALSTASYPYADPPDESFYETLFSFDHLDPFEVERWYWLNEPFAWTAIVRDSASDQRFYLFTEPSLDEFQQFAREDMTGVVRDELIDEPVVEESEEAFEEHLSTIFEAHGGPLGDATLHKLRYYFHRDFVGYGAVDPLMHDPAIEDISCDGTDVPVFVYHADYGNLETDRTFDETELDSLTIKLAQRCGRHVSAARPMLTDTLPDGSRVQLTLGSDVATRGSNFTIRKFSEEPFTPVDLLQYETFTLAQLAYLWLCVEYNRSVLFVGPTASGKTTSMNVVTLFIPPDNKVVSIEETREVVLPHDNWIANVTREVTTGDGEGGIGMYEFLSESLHQRPDHIVVGEIRTNPDVVRAFFQAVGTGHAGFSTFHAESPRDALRRLRHEPLLVPDELVAELDVVSVQAQLLVGEDEERARRCRWLGEVHTPEEGVEPQLHEVFKHDAHEDVIEQTGGTRLLADVARDEGWTEERLDTELERRVRVLATLFERGIDDYEEVSEWIFRFTRNPERVLEDCVSAESLPDVAVDFGRGAQ